jgi:hypothetical protein
MILEERSRRIVEPLAVDLMLLRSVLGTEIKITPGRGLMAHVMRADGSGRGAISIAGAVLEAELPKHVRAGQDVRLVVRSVSADRVVLSLSDQALAPASPPPSIPLPGGGSIRIVDSEEEEQGHARGQRSGRQTLALRYESPALGPVDLRFELDPGSLRVAVVLDAGDPLRRAQADAVDLRHALEAGIDRTVALKLVPRHGALDVYA